MITVHFLNPDHPIPHTAACWLNENGKEAYFSLAYQTTLMLFTMNCSSGHTVAAELKEQHIMPRIFSNITGALRGKGSGADSQYATSLIFNELNGLAFLYGLYRDDNIRMWSVKTSQCVSVVNCVQNSHEARLQGSQTNSLRRASASMICAFLCYSTGSEFMTIRTTTDESSNYIMQRIDMIPAPEFDLVEFDINEYRIWGLWCNSQGINTLPTIDWLKNIDPSNF